MALIKTKTNTAVEGDTFPINSAWAINSYRPVWNAPGWIEIVGWESKEDMLEGKSPTWNQDVRGFDISMSATIDEVYAIWKQQPMWADCEDLILEK